MNSCSLPSSSPRPARPAASSDFDSRSAGQVAARGTPQAKSGPCPISPSEFSSRPRCRLTISSPHGPAPQFARIEFHNRRTRPRSCAPGTLQNAGARVRSRGLDRTRSDLGRHGCRVSHDRSLDWARWQPPRARSSRARNPRTHPSPAARRSRDQQGEAVATICSMRAPVVGRRTSSASRPFPSVRRAGLKAC